MSLLLRTLGKSGSTWLEMAIYGYFWQVLPGSFGEITTVRIVPPGARPGSWPMKAPSCCPERMLVRYGGAERVGTPGGYSPAHPVPTHPAPRWPCHW